MSRPVQSRAPGRATRTITVVIADDHPIVRRGVRGLLCPEEGFEILAEAKSLQTVREAVRTLHPDVLVLDLSMGDGSSLGVIAVLRRDSPHTEIVILTMHDEPAYARQALAAGARGYVLKEAAAEELVDAVHAAAAGERHLSARLSQALAGALAGPGGLSSREAEVVGLLALGHSNQRAADQLGLSVRTVERHRADIQHKLGITDRAAITRFATGC